ncbi:MAG TPA: ATP-binding protein [Terriglobales bacterium]|nr:ATP-binding protein [Terriglobales bacterium]
MTTDKLFDAGGEMGALMAAFDWTNSPLGPVSRWPQNLKTCVRIVLTSRQPMFVWWGDSLINLYNDAYRSIVGGKHPEALGQPARVVWREIWDQIAPRAKSAMERNEGTYDEALLLIMERYGYREETYYTFSYSPVPNDQGGTGGIICANTDDTQRIVGERQMAMLRDLAAQTAEARNWQEACQRAAEVLPNDERDLCFTLLYVRERTSSAFTLAASSGIASGHPLAPGTVNAGNDSLWPLEAACSSHEVQAIDLGDSRHEVTARIWNSRVEQAAALPISPSGQGGVTGVMIVGLNPFRRLDTNYQSFLTLVAGQISASIANAQAYEDERQRAEMLAELDRAKTTFFSNVSHEFRTPLTLMLGPTEDALQAPSRSLHGAALETVHRNQLRLLKLVNTLLEFSRLEAGRIRASYRPADLAQLTTDLASVFRSAIERAGLVLNVDCPALPQQPYVDREMWEKIVLNLLSNALKSTFEGGISVHLRDLGSDCELSVRDTGTGIPENEMPHIFERFRRVEGAKRRTHEGSGIGLALVSELVKLHAGQIQVASEVGRGTTFTVRIPYGTAHLSPHSIASPDVHADHGSGTLAFVQEALSWSSGPHVDLASSRNLVNEFDFSSRENTGNTPHFRVLVADDNQDMRDYLVSLLQPRFDVTSMENGRLALDSAIRNPPDVVLSDVMMPEMDGFQLLSSLRKVPETSTIPVILLSARAGEEARVEGMQAGADDYLIKPFTARELFARVEAHAKIARFRQEAYRRERELEQELSRARQLASDAVSQITDGFFVVDPNWKLTYFNAAGERILVTAGLMNPVVGVSLWQAFPNMVNADVEARLRSCMETRAAVEFETAHSGRWFMVRAYPSPKGGISIYIADISARRRAEEALRMKQEHLLLTQRAAKIGAWELDVEDEDLKISPEFAEIAGLPSYVTRLRYSEFLDALFFSTDRQGLSKAVQGALRGKKDFSVELRLKRPDGTVRLVSGRGKAFYNQNRPIVLGVLIDLSTPDGIHALPRNRKRRQRRNPAA